MRLPGLRGDRAFTLIEVLIAIGILAISMATVFGSNVGAARSAAHARALTAATLMARCRMVEAEAYLVKNQLPLQDQTLEDPPEMGGDPCCTDGVTCEARVEKIELPSSTELETSAGSSLLHRGASAAQGSSFGGTPGAPGAAGPLGASDGGVGSSPLGSLMGALGSLGGGLPGAPGGTGGSGSGGLAGNGAPAPSDMAGMMLSAVYPTIKPLLEGAIRKVTISVRWHEGSRERTFDVVQYVTNPGQTLPSGDLLNGQQPGTPGAPGSPGAPGANGSGGLPGGLPGGFPGGLPGGFPGGLPGLTNLPMPGIR